MTAPVRATRAAAAAADVYCDRRLPAEIRTHEVLLGECLGGALAINDFVRLCQQVGANVHAPHSEVSALYCKVRGVRQPDSQAEHGA